MAPPLSSPARSCVGEVPCSPHRAPGSAARSSGGYTTPDPPKQTGGGFKRPGLADTPGSTGHSVKRARRSPCTARGVLEPRVLLFNADPAPAGHASPPAAALEEQWAFDAVPLIQGMPEAEYYRADFEMPEPFGSVLSILPFCDTTAD